MEMRQADTPRGTIFTLSHEDGRSVVTRMPTVDQDGGLSKGVANLSARLSDLCGVVNKADAEFKPTARAEQLRAGVANVVSKTFTGVQVDGRKVRQKVAAARAIALSVDPATPATAYIRQNFLSRWNAANLAEKGDLTSAASVEELSAIIETKSYQSMPADFQKVILDDYILKKHIDRTGIQSDFSLQPDHTDVLRSGPDINAAMSASRNALNNLNKQSETVDNVNAMMLNVIDMVALCTDLPRDQAYNLLVTGNIAA